MSYAKCYWGQFVILDLDYITYFSNSFDYVYGVPSENFGYRLHFPPNYKYNNNNNQTPSTPSTVVSGVPSLQTNDFQIDKYNSMKNKLKSTTSYNELNTLQIIYETQFDFDEEMSNPNTIKELDTSDRVASRMTLYAQISRPIIMILCMTVVSLYIIL